MLTPNLKGFEAARAAGATEVAIFGAASEAFSKKNINCSIAESLERFRPVVLECGESTTSKCAATSPASSAAPTKARVKPERVADVAGALYEMGCYEVSLGDTIGIGTPGKTQGDDRSLRASACRSRNWPGTTTTPTARRSPTSTPRSRWASRTFDASVAGLGGCPYAAGASGNVATEDVVYMLNGLGVRTGVDLERLVEIGRWICGVLKKEPASKVNKALRRRRREKPLHQGLPDGPGARRVHRLLPHPRRDRALERHERRRAFYKS